MISPVNGPITQRFGENPDYYRGVSGTNGHNGLDFGVPVGTTVVAPVNGTVVSYAYDRYNGNLMAFRSDSGYKYLFAHLSGNLVAPGTRVNQGQGIAKTGNTGDFTTGPHLHFGLYPPTPNTNNGFKGAIDPLPFIENVTAPQGGTEVANRDQVNKIYRAVLHRDGDPGGLSNYTGKDANVIISEMLGSQEWLNQNHVQLVAYPELVNKVNQMQSVINDLNARPTREQYAQAQAQISELASQVIAKAAEIELERKKAEELKNQAPVVQPDDPSVSAFKQVKAFIQKLFGIK